MRFPRGFADDVKNQADIVRVVSDYVTLKKRGANYVACCPFHSEKTPSFAVSQTKGLYKCFGCGAGGSVFSFVMQIEGCDFTEAIRIVAEKTGIAIPAANASEDYQKVEHNREVVFRLNELAAKFFEQVLQDEETGKTARAYFAARGITDATQKLFRLGYAPDSWDALLNHLREQGATTDELDLSGLVVLKDSGGFYDRFRHRVMFPIVDSQGRVIAFGGRVMGEGEPKYLNSPETTIYTKGRNLYGLAFAKNEIRAKGFAILVEGYLDCIMPFQEGIHNIVASLGTALTDNQVRLLRRYMDKPQIIVNFDSDSAGQAATMRSIEMLLAEGFKINILQMPTGKDPDEFVRTQGAKAFVELFKTTQPYIEYVIEKTINDIDTTRPAGKVEAINAILPHLARMPDKVARADYAEQLANRLKVDSRVIRDDMKRVAVNRQQTLDPKKVRAAQEVTQAERQLLEIVLADADVRRAIVANLTEADYLELATGAIFKAIIDLEQENIEPDFSTLSERLEVESERDLLPTLMMSDLSWAGGDDVDTLLKKATEALASLRRKKFERRLDAIQLELSQAERDQDTQKVLSLYQEKMDLQKRKMALALL
ncbi:MAG: DNA primase [Acidobacteria bacterium]|nr:DNA primase [Acidobacteriota bacterium]